MLQKFLKENPQLKAIFSFKEFNQVQKECFPKIMNSQDNMIVSAPTSAGKTVLFELCIVRMMKNNEIKCLYLAPIKSLCHEKANNWKQKFMSKLHVVQLTGDTLQMDSQQLDSSNLIIATPEKIDYLSRQNLQVLKSLKLLLIDEIHMLNMEQRGATLEAIVSRIISINPKIRIIAVSATIPNIQQVGQWLKVPKNMICVFGQQYRPAKLKKVVLGFKSNGNDFNFEKMLNFKILEIIRNYSQGGGTLIFCQTQKGTQQACQKIISQMNERQFLQNDSQLLQLVQASKMVDNSTLKTILPQGIAFHNAGLSLKDRSLIQKLFLQFKIKVLCTTSTLAMGINLPAKLVIIKSTKCYRGSAKGYQQYTQIQMDQMMGRAGRIPYDTEGTVVIMTQKNNFNKYMSKTQLENLQSQLSNQLIEHLNTQISLKSIKSLKQACKYIESSFLYIRMINSPKQYGLQSNKDIKQFINKTSLELIKKLAFYQIIGYSQQTQILFPKQLSINLSKNAIQINTMIKIIESINQITTERQFLSTICSSNQLSKFRSKLDQRKDLKDLNERNKYSLKQAISNHQRKCFVIVQAELSGYYIQNWQMRRQAVQIIYFLKRLCFCIKSMAYQKKNTNNTFWLFCFGQLFLKYFTLKFWDQNNQLILKQFTNINSQWKAFVLRGITNLQLLKANIDKIDSFCQKTSLFSRQISQQLKCLTQSLQISIQKFKNSSKNAVDDKSNKNQANVSLKIAYVNKTKKIKNISISVEFKDQIYYQKIINQQYPQFIVILREGVFRKYFISIIKQGVIGFDQFYWCENGNLIKTSFKKQEKQDNVLNKGKKQSLQFKKKNGEKISIQDKMKKNRSLQLSSSLKFNDFNKQSKNKLNLKQIKYQNKNHQNNNYFSQDKQFTLIQPNFQQNQQHSSTVKRTKQLKITDNYDTVKFKKNSWESQLQQNEYFGKKIKPFRQEKFKNLKDYNWKAGFQPIVDYQEQHNKEKIENNNKKKTLLVFQDDIEPFQPSFQTFPSKFKQSDIKVRLNNFMNKNNQEKNEKRSSFNNQNETQRFPKIIKYKQSDNIDSGVNQFSHNKSSDQLNNKYLKFRNIAKDQNNDFSTFFNAEKIDKHQTKSKQMKQVSECQSKSVYDYFDNLF